MTVRILTGDCRDVLATLDAASVDAVVTDPPYGLGFMGKDWDHEVPGVAFWEAMYRVMKPGAHLLAFGGTRTFHRIAVAIEDAGFEIRDTLMWLYGSGFPKSHDVSKAIDKMAGAEREVVGVSEHKANRTNPEGYDGWTGVDTREVTAPATPEAEQWQGWGTALKPAHEPIIMARKPFKGTVAANVLKYNCGAINIDGSRVGAQSTNSESGQGISRETGTRGCRVHGVLGVRQDDEAMEVSGGSGETSDDLRAGVPILVDEGREQPELERRRLDRNPVGVPSDPYRISQPGRSITDTNAVTTGIHGTSASGSSGSGATAEDGRACSPHQRDQERQSPGELVPDGLGHTLTGTPDSGAGTNQAQGRERATEGCTCGSPSQPLGRWPANVLLDEDAAAALDRQSGERKGRVGMTKHGSGTNSVYGTYARSDKSFTSDGVADTGGASRFMKVIPSDNLLIYGPDASRMAYIPKASRRERNAGLDGMPEQDKQVYGDRNTRECNVCGTRAKEPGPNPRWPNCEHDDWRWVAIHDNGHKGGRVVNTHPTVKPISLMQWLIRLVTPPGGTVLDPFMGSGSTGVACLREGVNFIGIELNPEYAEIARRRITGDAPLFTSVEVS